MKSPTLKLSPSQMQALAEFAPYVWWKTPEEALRFPDRLIAQIMDKGIYSDVCRLVDLVGDDILLQVLQNAEIGQFNERSWAYWHYRLTDIQLGEVPPMPRRQYHA